MIIVKKLTGYMGAEISGLDLREGISPSVAELLRHHLALHHVIILRDQFLSIAQQKAVTQVFGPLMILPYVSPMAGDAEVIAVLKEAHETNSGVFGGDWHSDFSFLEKPPAGSVLNAVEVPPIGGDTLWANQVAAYDKLPKHLRKLVESRPAVHVGKPYGVKHAPSEETHANASIKMSRGDPAADRERRHPAVISDPLSGQRALFLNPIYTTRFDGLSEGDSVPLLAELNQHCTRPDICCRHQWRPGDLVIWNNRTSLHYATNDYDGHRRLLYRTTFQGDVPA